MLLIVHGYLLFPSFRSLGFRRMIGQALPITCLLTKINYKITQEDLI
jgi:hypothetical protein